MALSFTVKPCINSCRTTVRTICRKGAATLKAFEAGAGGIVVSREYEEMRIPDLKAVGRAIRELAKRRTEEEAVNRWRILIQK